MRPDIIKQRLISIFMENAYIGFIRIICFITILIFNQFTWQIFFDSDNYISLNNKITLLLFDIGIIIFGTFITRIDKRNHFLAIIFAVLICFHILVIILFPFKINFQNYLLIIILLINSFLFIKLENTILFSSSIMISIIAIEIVLGSIEPFYYRPHEKLIYHEKNLSHFENKNVHR